jgi:hypothetical protein
VQIWVAVAALPPSSFPSQQAWCSRRIFGLFTISYQAIRIPLTEGSFGLIYPLKGKKKVWVPVGDFWKGVRSSEFISDMSTGNMVTYCVTFRFDGRPCGGRKKVAHDVTHYIPHEPQSWGESIGPTFAWRCARMEPCSESKPSEAGHYGGGLRYLNIFSAWKFSA